MKKKKLPLPPIPAPSVAPQPTAPVNGVTKADVGRRESVNLPGRVFVTGPIVESDPNNATVPKSMPPMLLSSTLVGTKIARFDLSTSAILHQQMEQQQHRRSPSIINPVVYTKRGCTDVICGLALLFCVCLWICVSGAGRLTLTYLLNDVPAFYYGNPERLFYPMDSSGRRCGTSRPNSYDYSANRFRHCSPAVQHRCHNCPTRVSLSKRVVSSKPTLTSMDIQICISQCPTDYFTYLQLQASAGISAGDFQTALKKLYCINDDENKSKLSTFSQVNALVQTHQCTAYTVTSTAGKLCYDEVNVKLTVLKRCLPLAIIDPSYVPDVTKKDQTLNQLIALYGDGGGIIPSDQKLADTGKFFAGALLGKDVIEKVISDLGNSYWQICVFLIVTALFAFAWTGIMRYFCGVMIKASILLVFICLSIASVFAWYKYLMTRLNNTDNIATTTTTTIQALFDQPVIWLIIGIILSFVLLILIVLFIFLRQRINLAIELIRETSKALHDMTSAVLFPIPIFIAHLAVFIFWANTAIFLVSWEGRDNCFQFVQSQPNDDTVNIGMPCDCVTAAVDNSCKFVNVTRDGRLLFGMQAFNLFAYYWLSCFVSGVSTVTLAGAFASYYWAFSKPGDIPSYPVARAFGRTIRYNLGSIAFGALLLGLVKLIRAFLLYLEQKLNKTGSAAAKFILRCLKFFFWILEVFLRFLTENAYIMIAMYGHGFCTSARQSFGLLTRNILRGIVLNRAVAYVLFLGKAAVTIGIGVASFFYFSGRWSIGGVFISLQVDLYYYFIPVIITIIGAYLICDAFFNSYRMAVKTTFLCFVEDAESNDGTPEKPYFMSNELLQILNKHNNIGIKLNT